MKTLVIAEKPSVGRDIGRVLSCSPKGNGYMEGTKYVVTWASGPSDNPEGSGGLR